MSDESSPYRPPATSNEIGTKWPAAQRTKRLPLPLQVLDMLSMVNVGLGVLFIGIGLIWLLASGSPAHGVRNCLTFGGVCLLPGALLQGCVRHLQRQRRQRREEA